MKGTFQLDIHILGGETPQRSLSDSDGHDRRCACSWRSTDLTDDQDRQDDRTHRIILQKSLRNDTHKVREATITCDHHGGQKIIGSM